MDQTASALPETPPVVYAREHAASLFEEILPLIVLHYKEIAVSMGEPLEPDWKEYSLMDRCGYLRVYTAREVGSGRLAGYAVFILRPHLHSRNSKQAFADLLYVDPEKRGFGASFIRWCDEQLKADGARVVYHTVTTSFDYRPILKRLDYEPLGAIFARRL